MINPSDGAVRVVGSIGSSAALANISHEVAVKACDIIEIRLDLLDPADNETSGTPFAPSPWRHLAGQPLLMTARRRDEGGARDLDGHQRLSLLEASMDDASVVDLEVASIAEASDFIQRLNNSRLPWVASFHDFNQTPDSTHLQKAATAARDAGAVVFKAAVMLNTIHDLARLAEFQCQDHGIAVATMGMGPFASVSRLLCAQLGSALNYGHLGGIPTAPGQWDSASLRSAIKNLPRVQNPATAFL
jgi:3-dehydroquinate dehydratase type I